MRRGKNATIEWLLLVDIVKWSDNFSYNTVHLHDNIVTNVLSLFRTTVRRMLPYSRASFAPSGRRYFLLPPDAISCEQRMCPIIRTDAASLHSFSGFYPDSEFCTLRCPLDLPNCSETL